MLYLSNSVKSILWSTRSKAFRKAFLQKRCEPSHVNQGPTSRYEGWRQEHEWSTLTYGSQTDSYQGTAQ